jgi:taurine dioxygenase
MALTLVRTLGAFGCEIEGDLSRPLDPADQARLRGFYQDHTLVVIHGQTLDRAAQVRIMALLGDVIVDDPNTAISNVRRDPTGDAELVWHSDLIYTPEPNLGLSLYAVEVEPGVSPTRFVSAEAAVKRLPPELRARLEGLTAVNISGGAGGSARNLADRLPAGWPRHELPVIMTNPQNGHETLGVTLSQTSHIVGVSREESDALLEAIFALLYDPAYRVDHAWRTGDLILWDNMALHHSRDNLEGGGRRDLERVIIGGRTLWDQHPDWVARYARGEFRDLQLA